MAPTTIPSLKSFSKKVAENFWQQKSRLNKSPKGLTSYSRSVILTMLSLKGYTVMERETLELLIGSFALLSFCYMGFAITLYIRRK